MGWRLSEANSSSEPIILITHTDCSLCGCVYYCFNPSLKVCPHKTLCGINIPEEIWVQAKLLL